MTHNNLDNFIKTLNQGDIILHHAHGFISESIRFLCESNYNHVSIYDKDKYVYEAASGGVNYKTLKDSIKTQGTSFVTCLRVDNLPKENPHLIKILKEKHKSKEYPVSQIGLMALLSLGQKFNNLFRYNFFSTQIIASLINSGLKLVDYKNKHDICSELIYRTYQETAESTRKLNYDLRLSIKNTYFSKIGITKISKKNQTRLATLYSNKKNRGNKVFNSDVFTKKFLAKNSDFTHIVDLNSNLPLYNFKPSLEAIKLKRLRGRGRKSLIFDDDINNQQLKITTWEENLEYIKKRNPKLASALKKLEIYNFITPKDIECISNAKILDSYLETYHYKCKECLRIKESLN